MAGIMQGCREAYHADPAVFERKFGAAPLSWWGSEQWKRNYQDNDPEKPHKTEIFGNVGRDMWHTFNAGRATLAIGATFVIGVQKKPVKQRVIEVLIGAGLQALTGNITYNILRQK